MRVMIFFDLPTLTLADRRAYTRFRKYLIKSGFLMEQESVYSKIVVNSSAAEALAQSVKNNAPTNGLIQLMKITEKQYAKMDYIAGMKKHDVLESDERLVIL